MGELGVVDLADADFWRDPYPVLAEARERGSVARSPGGQRLLLRYEPVDALLRDPRMRAMGTALLTGIKISDGPLYEWWRRVMFNTNPPEHTRLRGLVSRAFTRRRVEGMRPGIARIAAELLDGFADGCERDFVADFAHHLPIRVMCDMLGIDAERREGLTEWTSELGLVFSTVMPGDLRTRLEGAVTRLYDRVGALIELRRSSPGPDLLSALIAAEDEGDRLDSEELVAMVVNLLFAGHDTTRSLLSIGLWLLLSHPEELAKLRESPDRVGLAVEEILRYESPVLGSLRSPAEDIELDGEILRAGRPVYMIFPAANRDPRRFSDPESFRVDRDEAPPLSFGAGTHFCLGAALARAEAQETFSLLLRRFRRMQCRIDAPVWVPFASARRIESLPVAFEPA